MCTSLQEMAEEGEAVHYRHLQVGQNRIDVLLLEHLERAGAVSAGVTAKTPVRFSARVMAGRTNSSSSTSSKVVVARVVPPRRLPTLRGADGCGGQPSMSIRAATACKQG